jgi:hypothetical protein
VLYGDILSTSYDFILSEIVVGIEYGTLKTEHSHGCCNATFAAAVFDVVCEVTVGFATAIVEALSWSALCW